MGISRVEVDLSAIEHNLGVIRRALADRPVKIAVDPDATDHPTDTAPHHTPQAPHRPASVCAVVKQDGYGMGAVRLSQHLARLGVDLLAVFTPDEARELVESVPGVPILVLMPLRSLERTDVLYRAAVARRLHLVAHDPAHASALADLSQRLGLRLPIHVQVDTGMTRGGSLPDEAARAAEIVAGSSRLELAGVMTHFAGSGSDEAFTREQARLFRGWLKRLGAHLPAGCLIHAADSDAVFRSAGLHGTMVRVGKALFGYASAADPPAESHEDSAGAFDLAPLARELRPAVRWISSIVHVQQAPTNWPVGYGSTWRALRESRIAVVPVGYADGYAARLASRGRVRLLGTPYRASVPVIAGSARPVGSPGAPAPGAAEELARTLAPVVGRVSMDQITLDVTGLDDRLASCGLEVEVVGADPALPNHLPALARSAGTITHDLLTRISPRVERVYRTASAESTPVRVPARPTRAAV